MGLIGLLAATVSLSAPAAASERDCLSYAYACTPGYTGANAAGTWAWTHYGAGYASTPTGYHNCTLYAAWRLQQSGMTGDPGNWGNAVTWAARIGGGNHTAAVGSIAWWGASRASGSGHVAYVEQVNGDQVFLRADNFYAPGGYTTSGWIAASSVELFLHPHDAPVTPPSNPDRDGDGVPNDSDRCPDQAGPSWNGGCPVARPAQLLRNASFESGWDNWRAVNEAGSVNWAPYTDRARSHDGAGFAEMNSSVVNGSVGQDVSVPVAAGDSYAFSVWLRAAPGVGTFSGVVKLHGLGVSANEGPGTAFTVSEQWTLVTAPLDARGAHDTLRAEIYMSSPGNLNADGAQVVKNVLHNGSFESGFDSWRSVNEADSVSAAGYTERARSHDGEGFAEMNSSATNGSVGQDVGMSVGAGDSYAFSVWLRAAPGVGTYSGQLKLHGLGVSANEGASTPFTVSEQWTLVSAPLNARTAHDTLRAEIYMNSPGNLNADGAQVVTTGVRNSSFESGFDYWRSINEAGSVSWAGYTDRARSHDGEGFAEMNSSVGNGSVGQDIGVAVAPGDSYAFSVWLRAAPGIGTFSGHVTLYGLGVSANEGGDTFFTVDEQWTQVTAPLDARSAHDTLRAEIYMDSPGNLNADGANLTAGSGRTEVGRVRATDTAIAPAVIGTPWTLPLTASGGIAPYRWSVKAGTLPAGLTLATNGTISGTPNTLGSSTATVEVADMSVPPAVATRDVTIVVGNPLRVPTSKAPDSVLGVAYRTKLVALGATGTTTWSVASGRLPAGLTMTRYGTIGGQPTTVGTSNFVVKVTDAATPTPQTATKAMTLRVVGVAVTTTAISSMVVGKPASTALSAEGGIGTKRWSVGSGALPAGVTLSSAGTVSGTPTAAGTFSFVVKVTDSASPANVATRAFQVKVAPIAVRTTVFKTGAVGRYYQQTLYAWGGVAPLRWAKASGVLPKGLTLTAAGVLSGTATTAGSSTFTVKVFDAQGHTASATFTVVIS